MKIGRKTAETADTRLPFDWIEMPCATRAAAEAEAKHQQEADTEDAVWVYLQTGMSRKRWVARRTPRDPDAFQPPPRPFRTDRDPLWQSALWELIGNFLR